jgi:hypothetical protein
MKISIFPNKNIDKKGCQPQRISTNRNSSKDPEEEQQK